MKNKENNPYWYWPQCDVKYCKGVSCSGGVYWKETGYWSICTEHAAMARRGEPQPQMRKSAIKREASRDERGWLTNKRIRKSVESVRNITEK